MEILRRDIFGGDMMPTVSMEPIAWELRVHPEPGDTWKAGSAYRNSAAVTRGPDNTAMVFGLTFDGVDQAFLRSLNAAMHKEGIVEVVWAREEPGQPPRTFRHRVRAA
jgi:hypothetical protein